MLTQSQIAEMAEKYAKPTHLHPTPEDVEVIKDAYIAAFTDAMELISKTYVPLIEVESILNTVCHPDHASELIGYIRPLVDKPWALSKEWVRVDNPPTHQNYVRVLCDDRHHILPHWFNNEKWYCYGSAGYTENVSHWQEFEDLLPEPPVLTKDKKI